MLSSSISSSSSSLNVSRSSYPLKQECRHVLLNTYIHSQITRGVPDYGIFIVELDISNLADSPNHMFRGRDKIHYIPQVINTHVTHRKRCNGHLADNSCFPPSR